MIAAKTSSFFLGPKNVPSYENLTNQFLIDRRWVVSTVLQSVLQWIALYRDGAVCPSVRESVCRFLTQETSEPSRWKWKIVFAPLWPSCPSVPGNSLNFPSSEDGSCFCPALFLSRDGVYLPHPVLSEPTQNQLVCRSAPPPLHPTPHGSLGMPTLASPSCDHPCLKNSLVAQMVKSPPPKQETQVQSLGGKYPQYTCLENPVDRGAWRATVHGVSKSQVMTE